MKINSKRLKLLKTFLLLLQKEKLRREKLYDLYDWSKNAHSGQIIPTTDWRIWLILAGRGFGKTRCGAETIRTWATKGTYKRIALISNTLSDAREIMIEGESGLLKVSPPWEKLIFESSKRQLTWPNGAIATLYSAENYEQLRGPQFDAAWIDELAKFRTAELVFDQLLLSLRLGTNPRVIITTTPKPINLIKQLIKRDDTFITKGTTFENAKNLSPQFINLLEKQFDGTKLGAQEIYAEIIENSDGALWTWELINQQRKKAPDSFIKKIIAVDPSLTNNSFSCETGIILAGLSKDGNAYVLDDFSLKAQPSEWGKVIAKKYQLHKADYIVAEINAGGDLIEHLMKTISPTIKLKKVRAIKNKIIRAEPIAALYEQGKVFHTKPLPTLETQMTSYNGEGTSPDRLDALVWALSDLMLNKNTAPKIWKL